MSEIQIESSTLKDMLIEAARLGAERAIDDMVCYHYSDACKQLRMSYNTLQKRMKEGKIHAVDGRITGAEIRRYLFESGRNR